VDQKLYLKENVQAEPLVNSWPAWPHIIAPAQAAMNIANSHVRIMKSYIAAPEVHAAAVKNPAMRGGPFLDVSTNRVGEVKSLMEKTVKEQAHMIELAGAIKSLNELLMNEARGYSLEPLYQKVPEVLKGYVELSYDLNNNPSVRFIEGLLYKGRYYDTSTQSIALSFINSDERPFMFSTPKLESDEALRLNLPFNHAALDELFKMRRQPQSYGLIKEALGIEGEREELFSRFLTAQGPPRLDDYDGDSIRVQYFGHACVLIEARGVTILTDPAISYRYDSEVRRYTQADLPDAIDYVLITHSHSDHLVLETLLQLRHKIKNVIVPKNMCGSLEDPSLKLLLQNLGFKNVSELDEMESVDVRGGSITSLPFLGEHCDLRVRSKNAFLVQLNGTSLMFAADSSNLELKLYERLHKLTGDVDILFLGMECDGAPLTWVYGALLTKPLDRKMDQTRRLSGSDYEKAIHIVNQLNCKKVYVYAMGQEPWLSHIMALQYTEESKPIIESNRLVEECRRRGIHSERLFGARDCLA
jgi:L-ascorbate metabolism protein UlaG (beta-lactamase superfamily)